jgi:NADH-quinone oxidoreductase subunit J
MLLNLNISAELNKSILAQITAVVAGGLLLVTLVAVLKGLADVPKIVTTQMGITRNIGDVLFNEYTFPFEAASILFLAAMVGAVMMVKSEKE